MLSWARTIYRNRCARACASRTVIHLPCTECYALWRSPCRLHRAVHPVGLTCTTIRRAQSGQ